VSAFRDLLNAELARRRRVNRRYSVRAFAKYLDTDHSTLSQILRGRRPVPAAAIMAWAGRLEIGPEEARVLAAAQDVDDLVARNARARWLGEARALLAGDTHWRLIESLKCVDFRPDSRWIAAHIGASVDAVNEALSRLLRLGLVTIDAAGGWHDASGLEGRGANAVKEDALRRLRLS
jgi:transcriptional regulator with XRE-family HTH domain